MEDYQDRVIKERQGLDANIGRLKLFIATDNFKDLTDIEKLLMLDQLMTMGDYSRILGKRIAMFGS